MNFDDLLKRIGGWHFYQKRMWLFFTILLEIVVCHDHMITVFAGASPKWKCIDNEIVASNISHNNNECFLLDSCKELSFDEEIQTIVTNFRLYCQRSAYMEILMSLQMVGVLVGAFFWSQSAELYGRRRTLMLVYSSVIITSIAISFSSSWQMTGVLLFLMGTGSGGYFSTCFVMLQEAIESKKRLFSFSVSGFTFGMIAFAGTTWWFRDWRKILFYVNGFGLVGLSFFFWIEESPRWLLQHRRYEEAEKAIAEIARINNRPIPCREELILLRPIDTKKHHYTYRHLFRTAKLTKHIIVLAISWFIISCVSYALSFNVRNLPGDRFMNIAFQAGAYAILSWMTILWNQFCGRRIIHQFSLFLVLVCLLLVIGAIQFGKQLEISSDTIVTIFAILGYSFSSPAWQMVYLYSAELFPTVIRNLSNGFCSMAARIGGIIAPLLLLFAKFNPILPFVICLSLLLGNLILAFFLLPETRNQPLTDVLPDRIRSESSRIINKNLEISTSVTESFTCDFSN